MSTPLRSVFVGSSQQLIACAEKWLTQGHGVVGVISDCPEVSAWTNGKGIARIAQRETSAEEQAEWLAREPFEYLFSIVNHAIIPAAVLATPRRMAINYHDSPLPRYGGFNATAWAIIDGQTTHAVTWHEITTAVDAGPILLQQPVEIGSDDTAFTLGVKCAEAGVVTFGKVIELLESSARTGAPVVRVPQGPSQSFHYRSERPGLGWLDLRRSAQALSALVRGLNFGSQDSWMCTPKLRLPGGWVAVTTARVSEQTSTLAAGTVLSIGALIVEVATGDGVLALSDFSALEGAELTTSQLRSEYGLEDGCTLPPLAPGDLASAEAYDSAITKHERFWVQRLSHSSAPTLGGLALVRGGAKPAVLMRSLPTGLGLSHTDNERRQSAFIAALAVYLARVSDVSSFDLALQPTQSLPASVAAAFAAAAPLRCEVQLESCFAALREQTRRELLTVTRRTSFARDVALRYRALRERAPAAHGAWPVGVRLDAVETDGLIEGTQVSLLVTADGPRYGWAYDAAAISAEAMETLAARFETLLAAGLQDDAKSLAELAIVPVAERERLLTTWQPPPTPYAAERCVHQLFEQQVDKTPGALAVQFRGVSLSYRELNQRANQVAERLRGLGVQPETLVGICVERSLDMIVGLLGILKAGGAYVPLDPVYPRERLAAMLEDAHAGVLITQRQWVDRLPAHGAEVLCIDELTFRPDATYDAPGSSGVTPENLAYVIFTSGSTGRPKGVMVRHRNVVNFFAGMDAALGTEPGVWLAVTSMSFDISVLELFWTLARGFEVVLQAESDRASLASAPSSRALSSMEFGLFYFAADSGAAHTGNPYKLLLDGARFADSHGFSAVWTPERHFHAFGGLYPNPAVTTAALATITSRIQLRAGSVVLPLHNPLRVAEDWAVVDQLSGGRVGLSFASGWHVNDFALMPQNYERRREILLESMDTVLKLWRGEKVKVSNGQGAPIEVGVLPRPVQTTPPLWVASAGNVATFELAGQLGVNVLTNMLGQDLADLKSKLAAYRAAREKHGHQGPGCVSVMLHTFVCADTEEAKRLVRGPFCSYLASSFDLVKVAPWMFPAFRRPSKGADDDAGLDPDGFTPEDMAALLDHAFERYFDSAGLFGTPERALAMVDQLKGIGVNEVACLIDFGIDPDVVLESLPHLDRLRRLANGGASVGQTESASGGFSIGEQLRARNVTHLQCTPSMARMLVSDPETLQSLAGLRRLLLGGEALPADLADHLLPLVGGEILNMYGPTETTVWSTTSRVDDAANITIGRPIANTVIRILDARRQLVPVGTEGELCIGGDGVVRGYLGRPDLTAERFIADPFPSERGVLYRTGDLARYRADGNIEFRGRLDQQVKVNGYRIELEEIETVLRRHPAVRQCVVSARSDGGSAQLVGYVVSAGRASTPAPDDRALDAPGREPTTDRVSRWQSLWDQTYRLSAPEEHEARFNIAGWNDSVTGEPIAREQMREWLDATLERVLAFAPRRVLELGCGTGMVLYGVLPHVEHYTGVDLSAHALDTIRRELSASEAARVTLLQRAAHTLDHVAERAFDTVVINSVVQYFPDADYLAGVLRRASELVADGGRIFVGDVRSLEHLETFHRWAELQRAPSHLTAAELEQRVRQRAANERELVLSPSYFYALARLVPRIVAVDVRLKPGLAHNEMNLFRYDVTLYIGAAPALVSAPAGPDPLGSPPVAATMGSLAELRERLLSQPPWLALTDLVNARLSPTAAARDAAAGDPMATADGLRQTQQATQTGIDPGALSQLHEHYEVELVWSRSGDAHRFDALFRHRELASKARWELGAPKSDGALHSYANTPSKARDDGALIPELRSHLREFLPEYMVPSAFVLLDTFPLTPNGKIDRRALPAPQLQQRASAEEHQPPGNELELLISEVWCELLSVERVGRHDNIFDLGANSLLTVQAANRLSGRLERRVSLVSMFRFPTIEKLASHLGEGTQRPAQLAKQTQQTDRKAEAAARRRALREGRSR